MEQTLIQESLKYLNLTSGPTFKQLYGIKHLYSINFIFVLSCIKLFVCIVDLYLYIAFLFQT